MLKVEAMFLEDSLKQIEKKKVINLCSSTYEDNWHYQPYYFENVIFPLLRRRNIIHNLDIKKGTGIDIVANCQDMYMIRDRFYDIVFFFNAMEHLWEPEKAVAEIYRILKPEGICYATVPAEGYPYHEDPIDTMLRMSTVKDWKAFFTEDKWKIILFKVLKEYRIRYGRVDTITVIQAVRK